MCSKSNDAILNYYRWHLNTAKMWARYALQNKKEGTDWRECAEMSHIHLRRAFLIIT